MNQKNLILYLIQDDLINSKLIRGFSNLGIEADDYLIKASDVVFKLMGFEDSLQTELIRDHYYEMSRRTECMDIVAHRKLFYSLALEIFDYLNAACPKPVEP